MPGIEVDESELQALRSQVQHLANYKQVFDALQSNPEARTLFHAGVKKISPKANIPEFDQRVMVAGVTKAMEEKLAAATKKLDDFVEGQKKEKVEGDLTKRITDGRELLRSRGYQKEAIEKIEKVMQEEGIASYAAAAAYYAERNPQPSMAMPGAQTPIDFINDPTESAEEDRKLLFKGTKDTVGNAYVKTMVPKILAEIRGQTRAA